MLKCGGASFDFWATLAQSEYVTLLAGCQAWARILASQGRGDKPTTLWAFADNRTVVNLAHEASQQSERSPSTTADLKTWGHLVPLHEEAESIFEQLRQMRCDASVRWLSRESAPIKKVDFEAKKNTYKQTSSKGQALAVQCVRGGNQNVGIGVTGDAGVVVAVLGCKAACMHAVCWQDVVSGALLTF